MTEIFELKEKLNHLKDSLDKKQQAFFSLKSIENFLIYYNELRNYKPQVKNLLIEYFELMENENYSIDIDTCKIIGPKYIMRIGGYYTVDLGFKFQKSIQTGLFWGIQIDLLLLIFGQLSKIYYIPIATLISLSHWLYKKIFYENKNKVYNIKY